MNWMTLINTLILALGPIGLWLIKHFGEKATDSFGNYLEAKTENNYLGEFIKRIDDSALRVVKSVYMSYVENIKKTEGRSLTPEEQEQAKSAALEKLKSYLGAAGLQEISTLLGLSSSQQDAYLNDEIEAAVYTLKHANSSN